MLIDERQNLVDRVSLACYILSMQTNNTTTATATTYTMQTKSGRHIRRATRVTFSDGFKVDFIDLMPKRAAITQAIEYRKLRAA